MWHTFEVCHICFMITYTPSAENPTHSKSV